MPRQESAPHKVRVNHIIARDLDRTDGCGAVHIRNMSRAADHMDTANELTDGMRSAERSDGAPRSAFRPQPHVGMRSPRRARVAWRPSLTRSRWANPCSAKPPKGARRHARLSHLERDGQQRRVVVPAAPHRAVDAARAGGDRSEHPLDDAERASPRQPAPRRLGHRVATPMAGSTLSPSEHPGSVQRTIVTTGLTIG